MAHLLRLRRTDKPDRHLLVHVSQTGPKALDLRLIGTEHEHVYVADLKESSFKSLQANNFSGSLSEWRDMLKYSFLHTRQTESPPDALQGLETVAAISGKTLTVTLRKNVGGITQRQGAIKLEQNDEKEVSALEWVDSAVATSDDLRYQLETLQASVSGQQEQVTKLNQQLDDLVKAKKDHEDELLQKFAALLNAKKLKIRDQQRLLNGARVDPGIVEGVRESRSSRERNAGASRRGKREAADASEADEADVIDDYEEQEEDESRAEETPQQSDEDATDDKDDLDGAVANATNMDVDGPEEPPPRRELPFARKDPPSTRQSAPTADEVDEETDDEL